jgi:hypothetical protein
VKDIVAGNPSKIVQVYVNRPNMGYSRRLKKNRFRGSTQVVRKLATKDPCQPWAEPGTLNSLKRAKKPVER